MQATECLVHLEAVYGAGAGGGRGVRGDACVASVSWAEVPGGQKCARPQALAYALRCGTTPPHGKLNGLGAAPECVATGPVSGASQNCELEPLSTS